MLKYLLALFMLVPSLGYSAHLATNLRCVDKNEAGEVKMGFVVVKANKLHRFTVNLKVLKGGAFNSGDSVDVVVDGDTVATLKLKGAKGKFLKASFRKQGFDPEFPIDVKRGTSAEVAGLSCKFKR